MPAIIINIVQLLFSNYIEMKFNLIKFWVAVHLWRRYGDQLINLLI